jgi:hypothetical protein
MIQVIIVGLGLSFFIMFMWYIFQPITLTIINTTMEVATVRFGMDNQYINTGVSILTQIEYWWGPLMVIAIAVLWAYVAAQGRDWRSTKEDF